jgi:hypothetical protein
MKVISDISINADLTVSGSVGNTTLDGHQILLSRAGNNHIFATSGSGVLALGQSNAEKMRISPSGNVLIGSTTDSGYYKFDVSGTARVQGDSSVNGTMKFTSTKGANGSHIHYGTDGDWYIRSAATNGKVVIQDAGAVVGIGTSSPNSSYKCDVNGDTNVAGDYYVNGNQGYTGTITINQPSPLPSISIDVEGGIITNVT